jgi:hypothetical protein
VDGNWVAARIFAHAKECTESRHEKRFFTLIGRLFDYSEFKSKFARIRADLSFLEKYGEDPARFVQGLASSRLELLLASLPWEGPLAHPPKAEDQAPFVHPFIDWSSSIRLVKVVPAGAVDQPLQCRLVGWTPGKGDEI